MLSPHTTGSMYPKLTWCSKKSKIGKPVASAATVEGPIVELDYPLHSRIWQVGRELRHGTW